MLCPRPVSYVVPYKYSEAYVFMAVHAQALNLVYNFGIVVAFLGARLSDLSAHILEQILRKTFGFRHTVKGFRIV